MSYITVQQIRERFEQARRQSNVRTFSASTVLNEGRQISDSTKTFDIFLSHSSDDNEFVAGIKLILEDFGFTVYVDWNDPALNSNRVTPTTAAICVNGCLIVEVWFMLIPAMPKTLDGCLGNLAILTD